MLKNMKNNRVLLYIGIGLFALLVLTSALIPIATYPTYSAYSPDPDGTKAIFLLLRQEGLNAARMNAAVPAGQGLMIMTEPNDLGEQDWTQVIAWVAQGNTLLLADDNDDYIYDHLGLNLIQTAGNFQIDPVTSSNPLFKGVRSLAISGGTRLKASPTAGFSYGDSQGAYLAEVARGNGRILLLTTPDILTNSEIDQAGNLILLLNATRLYGQSGIWFNEFSHGYTLAQTTRETFSWPLGLVVIQLALGLLLLYYYWGKRFGRPIPLPALPDLVAGEYVASLAGIYRQARARRLILNSIYQGFKRNLAQYLGAPRNLPSGDLVATISKRPLLDTKKLAGLLEHCETLLNKSGLSETDLFAIVKQMEKWQQNNLRARSGCNRPDVPPSGQGE